MTHCPALTAPTDIAGWMQKSCPISGPASVGAGASTAFLMALGDLHVVVLHALGLRWNVRR